MKNLIFVLFACLMMVGCSEPALEMRAATYNVRFDSADDAANGDSWAERKGSVADVILRHDFDIVGTQEASKDQMPELAELLPGYDYIYHSYGISEGFHNCATYYKRDKYELLDQGTFWYSETPEVESIGWDANDHRLCHWGHFRDRATGREFFYLNSHLYWRLEVARANSGKVLVDQVRKIAGDKPVIAVGDYNSREETPQVKDILTLLRDAYTVSETAPAGPVNTDLGGGNFLGPAKARIDYLFVSDHVRVKDYTVIDDKCENGHYPSDHLPIVCSVEIE